MSRWSVDLKAEQLSAFGSTCVLKRPEICRRHSLNNLNPVRSHVFGETIEVNYRFGRFEVRPAERSLYIDGQLTALGARAFDVLVTLIERRDRLVTKSELLDLVWPNLFVEENNLQVQVSSLRKLLGPQVLATVAGQGYRFAMALDEHTRHIAPPLPAKHSVKSILPPPRRLLGRDEELDDLLAQLRDYSLVSIVGAAGVGKTLLALAALHAPSRGCSNADVWLDLSSVSDPSQLPVTLADRIGVSIADDDPFAALIDALQFRQMLLVLDGAEHLLEAVARFARLISVKAQGVKLLVTSQVALKMDGERVMRLAGLSVPEVGASVEQARRLGSVMLFVDQAQASDRTFSVTEQNVATVISVCRRLDGIALAIKLAAARLPLLGLDGVESQLGERLKLLSGGSRGSEYGADSRNATLVASLSWSHSLLSPAEQSLFRRCSVFVGGFTLELACAVCDPSTVEKWDVINALESLVDRSLIVVAEGDAHRFRLSEYAYEYGRVMLEAAGEIVSVHNRHAQACAELMDRAYAAYWQEADQPWLQLWRAEIDNMRAALDWSLLHRPDLAVRLMGAVSPLFMLLDLAAEGRTRCQSIEPTALSLIEAALHSDSMELEILLARYWLARAWLQIGVSPFWMSQYALTAEVHYRAADDPQGVFLALCCAAHSQALPAAHARQVQDEITERVQPQWSARIRAQRLLAEAGFYRQSHQWADVRFPLESLHWLATSAELDSLVLTAIRGLAERNLVLGDHEAALHAGQALIGRPGGAEHDACLQDLAIIATAQMFLGRTDEARIALSDFIANAMRQDWTGFGLYADLLALLAASEDRAVDAARLLGFANAVCDPAHAQCLSVAQLRSRSSRMIAQRLDASMLRRLMSEGARMDREAACALALAESEARNPV